MSRSIDLIIKYGGQYSLYKVHVLVLANQVAASKTLCDLTFKDYAELLHCINVIDILIELQLSQFPGDKRGKNMQIQSTSAGTLTTLPVILSCFPLGAGIFLKMPTLEQ